MPIIVGFATIFHIIKYSKNISVRLTKVLIRAIGIKSNFNGLYIISNFSVYSFKPVTFFCSFVTSFNVVHIAEEIIFRKIISV